MNLRNTNLAKNKAIDSKLQRYLPGGLHYNFAFPWEKDPIHFSGGEGHFLESVDGVKYLDMFSKFGALILGHRNGEYTRFLSDAILHKLTAVDHFGEDEYETVKAIIEAVPGAEQVRFSMSGTEAVQNALRIARSYTGRNKIVRFVGHFHGSSDNILGGGINSNGSYVPVEVPNDMRGTHGRAECSFMDSLLIPWNDKNVFDEIIKNHGDSIAAVIMEPICINGGGIAPLKGYLDHVRKVTKSKGIILIFDEVITGFRLQYGSAQSIVGVSPDIWVFGKAIGGGSIPISCIVSTKKIMNVLTRKEATHGGTFNGYPLGLYAIRSSLKILSQKPSLYDKMSSFAYDFQNIILKAAEEVNIDIVFQGHLNAMCLHANANKLSYTSEWLPEMKQKEEIIRQVFTRNGILIAPPCRFYPNISLDSKVLEFVSGKIDKIFNEIREEYDENEFAR